MGNHSNPILLDDCAYESFDACGCRLTVAAGVPLGVRFGLSGQPLSPAASVSKSPSTDWLPSNGGRGFWFLEVPPLRPHLPPEGTGGAR